MGAITDNRNRAGRADATLAAGLEAWAMALAPQAGPARVGQIHRPESGWSNETVLTTISWPDRTDEIVVRLAPLIPSFPASDLGAQAAVQAALGAAGVPVPRTIALEAGCGWLGGPFLVMERTPGRPVAEVPALDPWLTGATEDTQRSIHEAFAALLAAVHRLDWRSAGLDAVLRGGGGDLGAEVRWWQDYIEWAADGAPAAALRALGEWCAATRPDPAGDAALCWGDARLGNVLFDEAPRVTAALDWELASIGPPEMDLAWYLALDELTGKVVGRTLPGFMGHDAFIARYEHHLGRATRHLRWHMIFALVRSAAVNDRQARIAAQLGADYPGVAGEHNPMLGYILRRVDRYEAGS